MKISLRGWLILGGFIASMVALTVFCPPDFLNAAQTSSKPNHQLNEKALGNLLSEIGLKTTLQEDRFDFEFKALYQGSEWDLSMSTVLSQNGSSVWVMAWLEELPRDASQVPRKSLLRLLHENDRMGKGKFFAYVASSRRFVLQRVVPNERITPTEFRNILQDLGRSVVETYPQWNVAEWTQGKSLKQVATQPKPRKRTAARRKSSVRN